MTGAAVPFNRPTTARSQSEYVGRALHNGRISGDGPFTSACQQLLEQALGVPRVLLTTSCTHALELAASLLDIGPGDEVVVPSFTFVSTANAFAVRGARPVFADVVPETFTIDPEAVARLTGPRTRAIVPVHYAGVPAAMDELASIAEGVGASLVEDNAHGLFATYKDRNLGSLGRLGTLSFHDTKNFTCGEGGALLVNDRSLVERAEIMREKGTNRSQFFRGQVDKYTWVDFGSSYLPSDILAAVLLAQLEERTRIQACREMVWTRYTDALSEWACEQGIGVPVVLPHAQPAYHMFFLVMLEPRDQDDLIAHLRSRDILAVFHYIPLHSSPMGRRFGGRAGDCPVTEWVSDRIVRLPLFTDMTIEEQDRVIEGVLSFQPRT